MTRRTWTTRILLQNQRAVIIGLHRCKLSTEANKTWRPSDRGWW